MASFYENYSAGVQMPDEFLKNMVILSHKNFFINHSEQL